MRITATLVFLLYSLLSQAQDCPATPAMVAGECLSHQLKTAQAVLSKNFKQLLSATPVNEPEQAQKAKELLSQSQKSWLAHRNAYCEFQGFVEGGAPPYKGVRKLQCLVQLSETRAAELKAMREYYE